MAIPALRHNCKSMSIQANLQEALDYMAEQQVTCLSLHYGQEKGGSSVMGIIEHDRIHNFYRYQN